jgi:hypothetical protein
MKNKDKHIKIPVAVIHHAYITLNDLMDGVDGANSVSDELWALQLAVPEIRQVLGALKKYEDPIQKRRSNRLRKRL